MDTHNPIITRRIYFVKQLLKNYTNYIKSWRAFNRREESTIVYNYAKEHNIKSYDAISLLGFDSIRPIKNEEYITYYNITHLHVYYLKLKDSKKHHTKDDSVYENNIYYKILSEKLEKEFALLETAEEMRGHE